MCCVCAKSLQSRPAPCSPMDHWSPLSMGFSRQEYCNGLQFPPRRDLPDPGIKPESLTFPALAAGFFTNSASWEAPKNGPSSQITGKKQAYSISRRDSAEKPTNQGTSALFFCCSGNTLSPENWKMLQKILYRYPGWTK